MSNREKVVFAGFCVALILGFFSSTCLGYKVCVNGEVVGYTKESSAFTESLNQVEQELQSKYSIETAYISDDIQIKKSIIFNQPTLSKEEFKNALENRDLEASIHGITLDINGQKVGNFVSEDEAQSAITNAVKKSANFNKDTDKIVDYKIDGDVKTVTKDFKIDEIKDVNTWSDVLLTGKEPVKTNSSNTIVENNQTTDNSASLQVASRGGVEVARDQAVESTQEGATNGEGTVEENVNEQNNETVTSSGYLKINLTKTSIKQEDIPFQTVSQEDPDIYVDQTVVKQQGTNGKLDKEVEYVYENGKVVSEKALSETVSQEPVQQIIAKGTKSYPTMLSKKDNYLLPANGNISALDKPGSHAGCFAVDIAGPMGTPIYAPESGTVTMASSYGGYGLCIQVQMDNGVVFLMGHNSEFKANVGDRVQKGQVIALMGSTGNSSGP
ncbi:MAG: G5 domain-containing protein, partial [Eubacterium sp.]